MSSLPELRQLQALIKELQGRAEIRVCHEISLAGQRLPIYSICLGSREPQHPALGIFGGIHGLERIGTQVVISFLRSLIHRLHWDKSLQQTLMEMRLVIMPLLNPGGMLLGSRANPNGIDLMRNAPVEADSRVPFLLGGHRYSKYLPWYRGVNSEQMEAENLALCEVVSKELLSREFSIAIDCHSGFGLTDRVWFPYAHTSQPIAHLAEILALEELFDSSHPKHHYLFEPQARQYRTHGDVWDYLYQQSPAGHTFLPLTLEMGSWLWVKKNPRQLLSRLGMFNPIAEHRLHRVLRRHHSWLDFLLRATVSHQQWCKQGPGRLRLQERAISRWYRP